jgi:hypothetical protein
VGARKAEPRLTRRLPQRWLKKMQKKVRIQLDTDTSHLRSAVARAVVEQALRALTKRRPLTLTARPKGRINELRNARPPPRRGLRPCQR